MKQSETDKIKQRNSDFLHIFSGSPQGVRIYEYFEEIGFKKDCTFDKESARKSILNEGMRKFMLIIDYWIEYDLSTLEEAGETENIEPEREQE